MGLLSVNSKIVDVNYELKDNDLITHYMHRHELPVLASPLSIIELKISSVIIMKTLHMLMLINTEKLL